MSPSHNSTRITGYKRIGSPTQLANETHMQNTNSWIKICINNFNNARIRIKAITLGLIAISLLVSISIEKYSTIKKITKEIESNTQGSILLRNISTAIQNIQLERGMSYGPLNFTQSHIDNLKDQRQKTDDSIHNALSTDKSINQFNGLLSSIRNQLDNKSIRYNVAFNQYTFIISKLLDTINFTQLLSQNSEIKTSIIAIKKLLLAQENLGQIRATIFMILQDKIISSEKQDRVSFAYLRYKDLLDEVNKMKVLCTCANTRDYSSLKTTKLTHSVIEAVLDGKHLSISPEKWFEDSTESINNLQQICETGILESSDDLHKSSQELHRHYLLLIILYTTLASATLFITVFIVYSIYKPLTLITKFISKETKKQEFEANLIYHTTNEFGVIADNINALINHSKKLLSEKDYIAYHDALTGIFNRHKFINLLDNEIKRSNRYNHTFAFIILDIDHFKSVNDTYGHQTGDLVLKELANIVKNNMRTTDIFARWGGEEFVLLIPETDQSGAFDFSEKIRRAVEINKFQTVGKVTISIGVTLYSTGDTLETMCSRADKGLYSSKESGRNKVTFVRHSNEPDK